MSKYQDLGEYFGYPQCCIDHFIEEKDTSQQKNSKKDIHKNYGFIPCDECCKRIRSGEIKIDDLIQNRQCEMDYPYEDEADKLMREQYKKYSK